MKRYDKRASKCRTCVIYMRLEHNKQIMTKLSLLNEIAVEVVKCTACSLHNTRTQTVFARGNPDSPLVFIGEAPGFNEDQQGLPFVGRAGMLLDNMIKAMKFDPKDVYICNINKCRPPNNRKPTEEEMNSCIPFLTRQLDIIKPKVIVTLGGTAAEGLLGFGVGITRRRGKWNVYNKIPVMPTFHPSYCLRNPESKKEVWEDLQKVMKFLETGDISETHEKLCII